jgi:hypothetical protein
LWRKHFAGLAPANMKRLKALDETPDAGQQQMKINRQLKPISIANPSATLTLLTLLKTQLTDEQLDCLGRCAKGISVRFESWEIVEALVVGGYAEKGVAGAVTMTVKGQQYLRTHKF